MSCGPGPGGATPSIAEGVTGEVIWIHDGDTVDVGTADGTVTVRLVAINAPERGECFADQALDHLVGTLEGATVLIETAGIDQFDRTLAHVFAADRHVNLDMVAMGLALASTPDETDPYRAAILDAEESAYSNRTGLWATDACGDPGEPPALSIDTRASQPDPDGPDEANLHAELIVIRNEGDEPVDLDGWMIRDESARHRFTFAANASIAPGESLAVTSDSPGWEPGDGPVWNNGGDMVLVQDPDGNVVARWRY